MFSNIVERDTKGISRGMGTSFGGASDNRSVSMPLSNLLIACLFLDCGHGMMLRVHNQQRKCGSMEDSFSNTFSKPVSYLSSSMGGNHNHVIGSTGRSFFSLFCKRNEGVSD